MSSSRRSFLRGLAQTAGAAGVAALAACTTRETPDAADVETHPPEPPREPEGPQLPDGLDPANFHVHNTSPLALEARRSAMGVGAITPLSRFFVRNNLPRPSDDILVDRDAWSLDVKGVRSPGSITLAEIKQLGMETVATVVQCSGNGRHFFAHGPSGSPWATGAAGCALWTGVRVSKVLERFGGPVDAAFLTATGGEPLPEGVDRDTVVVERSIPIDKALHDCLLVWEMNGEPLPISHGGPLRFVVPGYFGCNQIKYVAQLEATPAETSAKIQKKGYRFRPIGEGGDPSQPSMWRMPVKSWVNGPGNDAGAVLAGTTTFHGVALSGERGIRGVEVSMDGGATWVAATLTGPDLGPNAWRTFQWTTELAPGTHTIHSRATDGEGEVQPEERAANERGYGHNGWRDHGHTVVAVGTPAELARVEAPTETRAAAAPKGPVTLSEAGERGKAIFQTEAQPSCSVCHTLSDAGTSGAVGPNLDTLAPDAARVEAAVTSGVGTMPAFEGTLSAEQIRDVAAYVAEATAR